MLFGFGGVLRGEGRRDEVAWNFGWGPDSASSDDIDDCFHLNFDFFDLISIHFRRSEDTMRWQAWSLKFTQ